LPPWITISDQPQALNAVPLLSDLEYAAGQNYSLKFPTCLNLDSEPPIRVCLERSSVRAGHDSQCWQLWIRVRSAWCTWMPAALPKLQVLVQNECTNRQPLLVAVELAIRQSYLRADRRPTLWRRLQHHLAGPTGSQSELKPLSGENFHILDVDLQLHRTVNVLARAHTAHQIGNWSGLNITDFKTLRAIWTMGCGFLNEDALRMLMRLEERFIISPIIDKWLLEPGQPGPIQGVLLDWLVGDYQDPRPEGRVRSRRQSAGFQEYSPIFASRVAGAVSEASGMTPPEHIATGSFLKPDLTSVEGSQKLQLEQPLAPIEITVHQISNARIPPNTFTGPPNSRLRLRLFEHVYPMQFGVDAEASVGREIHRDINNWVSFDSTNEIIRIRPFPEHVGNHNFVLCAYDETDAKVCGIFWCNQIPLYWFEELKMESLDDIELTLTAASVWLEMELVYLPLGLPDASTAETLGLLEQLMERPDSRPYLTHLAERQRFGRLLSLCENARLDGCVSAVQAAADSFHPFVVEEVGVLPVDGGACERAFMLEKKLYNGSERSLPPAGSTSMAAGSGGGGEEEKALAGFFPSRLAFKKLISPVKVVPIRRIRAIEIVDESEFIPFSSQGVSIFRY
uniref:Death domain-containing protein n=1 Tax=Schistocephalus solidus TaxID=70667 RepID=A0A183SVE5_SCHSO